MSRTLTLANITSLKQQLTFIMFFFFCLYFGYSSYSPPINCQHHCQLLFTITTLIKGKRKVDLKKKEEEKEKCEASSQPSLSGALKLANLMPVTVCGVNSFSSVRNERNLHFALCFFGLQYISLVRHIVVFFPIK